MPVHLLAVALARVGAGRQARTLSTTRHGITHCRENEHEREKVNEKQKKKKRKDVENSAM